MSNGTKDYARIANISAVVLLTITIIIVVVVIWMAPSGLRTNLTETIYLTGILGYLAGLAGWIARTG